MNHYPSYSDPRWLHNTVMFGTVHPVKSSSTELSRSYTVLGKEHRDTQENINYHVTFSGNEFTHVDHKRNNNTETSSSHKQVIPNSVSNSMRQKGKCFNDSDRNNSSCWQGTREYKESSKRKVCHSDKSIQKHSPRGIYKYNGRKCRERQRNPNNCKNKDKTYRIIRDSDFYSHSSS